MRPSEGAQAQSCDVWFDFDALAGYLQYLGTLAMNIPNRKNDRARRGHHPRVGCSARRRTRPWIWSANFGTT